jgi:hypothetical protein
MTTLIPKFDLMNGGVTPTGAVNRPINEKLSEIVSVKDFGAKGDGTTNDTTAIANACAYAVSSNKTIYFPYGTYLTSTPLNFTTPVFLTADANTKIKLTASANYVIQFDFTQGGAFFDYDARLENLVLDGGGFAVDGLVLKGVISSNFNNIRCTNVTGAGLALRWAQLCNFNNFICSGNVETFTTTPVNGILADTAASSANTFINPIIEAVSGSGIKGLALVNSVFINGTSEGNAVGIEFGQSTATALTAGGNTVVGMDLEVNSTTDILVWGNSGSNDWIGLKAGFSSPPVQIRSGAFFNRFFGGVTSGIGFFSGSAYNSVYGMSCLGSTATISNNANGIGNTWQNCYNVTNSTFIPNSAIGQRIVYSASSGTITIVAQTADYVQVVANGPTLTIGPVTAPIDGQAIDITIKNQSAGALTITWDASFRIAGWVNPANGFNRSVRFRYDATSTNWFAISVTANDIPN